MQDTQVWSLDWEDPPEKGITTHSSSLDWEIPWAEEPGRVQSMRLPWIGHDWVTEHEQVMQGDALFFDFRKLDIW